MSTRLHPIRLFGLRVDRHSSVGGRDHGSSWDPLSGGGGALIEDGKDVKKLRELLAGLDAVVYRFEALPWSWCRMSQPNRLHAISDRDVPVPELPPQEMLVQHVPVSIPLSDLHQL